MQSGSRPSSGALALRDIHQPAQFLEGQVRWKMAAGPEAIEARVAAGALHFLSAPPIPSYLEIFEQHRATLNRVAHAKFLENGRDLRSAILIDRDDLVPFLGLADLG